jgi:(S)-citramalyl-CoA lyase
MHTTFPPFTARSMLFVPGDRPERFSKAVASGADAICIDLEDAVAPAAKVLARQHAVDYLSQRTSGPLVCIRINSLRTADGLRDLLTLVDSVPADAILLPKAQGPDELQLATDVCGGPGRQRWIPLIESAAGLRKACQIAAGAPDLAALMFGGADFSMDIGSDFSWEALALARQTLVCAAALSKLSSIDVPFLEIGDLAGLHEETRRAANLGFTCKAAIHPSQVATIHHAFAPSEARLAMARRIVDAYESSPGGVVSVDGTMVDGPVLEAARRTLCRAKAAAA